jgi:hypothetical protein
MVLLMSTCDAVWAKELRAAADAAHLLKVNVLHDSLAGRTLALGARKCWILACVLEDFKAAALALFLVEVTAPNGGVARRDAFSAVADELQALRQRA